MAVDGASTPVARAMATGNASTTAIIAEWPGAVAAAAWPCAWGAVKPRTSTATEITTNATVMTANSSRPPCPNQVSPATTTQQEQRQRDPERGQRGEQGDHRAGRGRDGDADGQHEVDDQGADGQERPARPEGPRRGGSGAASLGEAADQLPVVRGHHDHQADHQAHGGQQEGEVSVQGAQRGLDGVGDGGDRVGDHREGEREEEDGPARRTAPGGTGLRGDLDLTSGQHAKTFRTATMMEVRRPGFPAHQASTLRQSPACTPSTIRQGRVKLPGECRIG